MTICPIAIAATCQKCPVVKVCPAKTILGDYPKDPKKELDKEANSKTH